MNFNWKILALGVLVAAMIAANIWATQEPTKMIQGTWIVSDISNPDDRLTRRAIAPGKSFQIDANGRMFAEFEHFAGIIAKVRFKNYAFLLTDTATDEKFSITASSDFRSLRFTSTLGDMFSARKKDD